MTVYMEIVVSRFYRNTTDYRSSSRRNRYRGHLHFQNHR